MFLSCRASCHPAGRSGCVQASSGGRRDRACSWTAWRKRTIASREHRPGASCGKVQPILAALQALRLGLVQKVLPLRSSAASNRDSGRVSGAVRGGVANLVAWDGVEPPTRGFSERLAPPDQTEPNGTNRPECGTYGPPAGRLGTVGAVWRRLVRGKSEASRGSPGPSKKRQGSFGLDRELPLQVVEVDLARHILANRGLACNRPARWWPGTAMRIGLESSSAPLARRQGRPPRAVAADETGQPLRDRLEPFEDTMGVPRLGSLQERPRSGPASRRSLIFPRRSGLTSPHEKPGRSL
jgi:hypothetical protein